MDRLCLVGSKDALILICASFSAHTVQYLLRCSLSVDVPELQKFDDLLRSALSHITNNTSPDLQWRQTSLSIRFGGLGVRRVSKLALPAFLASAASQTLQLNPVSPVEEVIDT